MESSPEIEDLICLVVVEIISFTQKKKKKNLTTFYNRITQLILTFCRFWYQLQTTQQYVCGPQRRNIATLKTVQSEQISRQKLADSFAPKVS